jgi:cytolysin-activating lysine-acyltransferase
MSDFNQTGDRIIAPSIYPETLWSEAEVLGAMIWLWNQNPDYKKAALDSALDVLQPIIRSKNFALIVHNNKPLGYMNWAYFNRQEEQQYLNKELPYTQFVHCDQSNKSKRLWILSFYCPFGLRDVFLTKTICKKVLKNNLCYFGYHKSKNKTVIKKVQC